jgi:hypothetical protein
MVCVGVTQGGRVRLDGTYSFGRACRIDVLPVVGWVVCVVSVAAFTIHYSHLCINLLTSITLYLAGLCDVWFTQVCCANCFEGGRFFFFKVGVSVCVGVSGPLTE